MDQQDGHVIVDRQHSCGAKISKYADPEKKDRGMTSPTSLNLSSQLVFLSELFRQALHEPDGYMFKFISILMY